LPGRPNVNQEAMAALGVTACGLLDMLAAVIS
jgi:hypothetical protein